jgi:hypothetical protein
MKGGVVYGLDDAASKNDSSSGAAIFVESGGTAIYGGSLGSDAIVTTNDTLPVKAAQIGATKYMTLYQAINAATTGTSANNPTEIVLLRSVFAPEDGMTASTGYNITANHHIRLVSEAGKDRTVTALAGNFALFTVNDNTSLALGSTGAGTLTLDGKGEPAAPNRRGVNVNGGIFTMNDNAAIIGFNNSAGSNSGGGGVYVTGSTGVFNMNGGTIKKNNADDLGGGVFIVNSGKLVMGSGNITENVAKTYGGGVYAASGTQFIMNSGIINGNSSDMAGGGVTTNGLFDMNGGSITHNVAKSGGGVAVFNSGTFTMQPACIITDNDAPEGGGVYASGTFNTGGASVQGNAGALGNVFIANSSGSVVLSGASIIDGLTLSAKSATDKALAKIDTSWAGNVTVLNLRGDADAGNTTLNNAITYWENGTVLSMVSGTLSTAIVAKFTPGYFVDSSDGRQSIASTHEINGSGVLVRK